MDELIKAALNECNWKGRKSAVEKLKSYHTKETEKIIVSLALHDPVFKVKNAAFLVAQAWGVKINGQPIRLTKMKKGNLVKDIHKKLTKVRDSFIDEFTIEEFKEKFKEMYPKAYDIYDGEKGKKLDQFLEECIKCLPKTKK